MSLLARLAIGALIAFVVLAGGALLFSARPTPIVEVDAGSLAHSVDDSQTACEKLSGGDWECPAIESRKRVRYLVKVGWDGCWEATGLGGPPSEPRPGNRSGCIDIWDHLQLENLLNGD